MNASVKANKMSKDLMANVNLLLVATVVAEAERAKCDVIQKRLLATGAYGGDGNPETTYRLPDEASARFHADLDKAYREAGYADLKPGYCPALIAGHDKIGAEWALIKAAEEFFPGVTNNKLLCGVKGMGGLECRKKYLDLLIGLVVNHPAYKPVKL